MRPQDSREDGGLRFRAVTFDVTHTLLHAPRLAHVYSEVMERHGLPASVADIGRTVPRVWDEMACLATTASDRFNQHPQGARGFWQRFLERICEHLELPSPSRFAAAELFDRFARADAWEVYADVPRALDELWQRGLRLGVISNWDERLPALLDDLDLAHRFDAIVFSAGFGLEKPNPGIFLACLDELGVDPHEALHVGDDALDDVEGADAAGMESLRIDRDVPGGIDLWQLLEPLVDPQPELPVDPPSFAELASDRPVAAPDEEAEGEGERCADVIVHPSSQ